MKEFTVVFRKLIQRQGMKKIFSMGTADDSQVLLQAIRRFLFYRNGTTRKMVLRGALVLILALGLTGCEADKEFPLELPAAAEPSAKTRNDLGIAHYKSGRYMEALVQFSQASFADPTGGEIYFNLALAYLKNGDREKAVANFKQARKFAKGNKQILESPLLKTYLERQNE